MGLRPPGESSTQDLLTGEGRAREERMNAKIVDLFTPSICAILSGDLGNAPGLARHAYEQVDDDLRAHIARAALRLWPCLAE